MHYLFLRTLGYYVMTRQNTDTISMSLKSSEMRYSCSEQNN